VACAANAEVGGEVLRSWYAERPGAGPVACVWRGVPGWRRWMRVLPDGCADLVWDGAALNVAPAAPRVLRVGLEPGGVTTGVRLLPHAAVALLGRPVPHLDSPVPLATLWPPDAVDPLLDALRTASDPAAELVQAITARARHPRYRPDPRVAALVDRLAAPGTTVDAAARALGASARTVRRHIRADTGLAPKPLHEILRFRRALAALPSSSLAETAQAAGYYDQPHLNRQFRKLTGTTPRALAAGGARAG